MVIGDWPDIVENWDIIEFHDIFDTKKEGFANVAYIHEMDDQDRFF